MKLTERWVGDVLVLSVKGAPIINDIVRDRVMSGAKKIVINLEQAKLMIGIPDTFAACFDAAADHGAELRWFCGDNENQGAVLFGFSVFQYRRGHTDLEVEDRVATARETVEFETEADAVESFA